MKTVNEELFDASVRHQVYLQRLTGGIVKEINELLIDAESELSQLILKDDLTDFSKARLNKLLSDIRLITKDTYNVLENNLNSKLTDLAEYESDFNARLISNTLPVSIELTRPTLEALSAIVTAQPLQGRFIKDEIKDLADSKIKQIERALRLGLVEGETTPQIIRRIRGSRLLNYKDGIVHKSYRDAERLVRTATNHVASFARDELYKNNPNIVKQWRFTATLDSRTSVTCASLDGQIYDVGKGPRPPRHPNCRSSTAPIIGSWKQLGINLKEAPVGTRASLNGQIPATTTYNKWLKTQPLEFVEDVLGKTRTKLYLGGKLSLDRFTDHSGEIYTLKILKQREAKAFASLQR